MVKRNAFFQILGFSVLLIVALIILRNQQRILADQGHQHQQMLKAQAETAESYRKMGLTYTMSNLLVDIQRELEDHPNRQLSSETISRISAMSQALEPIGVSYVDQDTSSTKYSQERGLLLLQLINMQMDSTSFDSIKAKVDFSGAYLQHAELRGKDLTGIRLMCANLKNADLGRANLSGADLRGANLWGANLQYVILKKAELNRVDLRWANLNDCNLSQSILDGAHMQGAQLRRADLSNTRIQYADLSGSILTKANLMKADLLWSDLQKSNLDHALLNQARLVRTDFTQASIIGTDFRRADILNIMLANKDWLSNLDNWKVKGADTLQLDYKLSEDKSDPTILLLGKK